MTPDVWYNGIITYSTYFGPRSDLDYLGHYKNLDIQ